ncbi:MAG: hypothetical protein ACRDN0_10840, partial [Trebonia sp.]
MTLPWIIGSAALGLLAGPWIRSCVFLYSSAFDSTAFDSTEPPRQDCPGCAQPVLPAHRPWASLLPVTGAPLTGRCPACRARIGPYPLLAELAAATAM